MSKNEVAGFKIGRLGLQDDKAGFWHKRIPRF